MAVFRDTLDEPTGSQEWMNVFCHISINRKVNSRADKRKHSNSTLTKSPATAIRTDCKNALTAARGVTRVAAHFESRKAASPAAADAASGGHVAHGDSVDNSLLQLHRQRCESFHTSLFDLFIENHWFHRIRFSKISKIIGLFQGRCSVFQFSDVGHEQWKQVNEP